MLKKDEDGDLVWGPGHIASINPRDDGRWTDTSRHYFAAALALEDRIAATVKEWDERVKSFGSDEPAPRDPEDYVLPFINLARHAVELLLKSMELGLARWERREVDLKSKNHFLDRRLAAAEELLRVTGDGGRLAPLKQLVEMLHDFDPDSMATRYPASTSWEVPPLLIGVKIAGVVAVPFVNVSLIARLLRETELLTYTSDVLEDMIEHRYYEERDRAYDEY